MTSASSDTSQLLCRYYVSGCCRMGEQCHFSHDRSSRSDNVCRYYQSGSCAYGAVCRYDHVRPKNDNGRKPTTKKATGIPRSSQLPKPGLNTEAAEFIPSWKKSSSRESYAIAAGAVESGPINKISLCPYYEMGDCSDPNCHFIHGLTCEMCFRACIHPYDEEQNRQHFNECVAEHESAMEEAFAEARSVNKRCGICMENIREKNLRFGILEGCRHCFCLDCIREWRKNQTFETNVVRSCPECRQHSDFVVPSNFWVEDGVEKQTLIEAYRRNTAEKQCKYYKNGRTGEQCPFGNKCFYKHQLPDGTIDPGEAPHARRRPHLADFLGVDDDVIPSLDDSALIHRLYGVLNFMDT